MRSNYRDDFKRLDQALSAYEGLHGTIPGLVPEGYRAGLIEQIIDSEQRVRYTARLLERGVDPDSVHPVSIAFDPIKAAIVHHSQGNYDEAVWLVFLFVHFGKHRRAGWRYIRDIYGRLGDGDLWDWRAVSTDPTSFRFWLDAHQEALLSAPGPKGFGNHRKYESLNAWSEKGTGAAVESYVAWVLESGGDHEARFAEANAMDPEVGFEELYDSLAGVMRFGRIAKFDYLMMLSKLRLLDIRPPHSYLIGATGPLAGARLLLNGSDTSGSARKIQVELRELGIELGLSPDVIEDAVCNWQKSPATYVRFSG